MKKNIKKEGDKGVSKGESEKKPYSTTIIKCSKCGELKAVRKDVFMKRVEVFGSVERLLSDYKCQRCRDGVSKRGIQCSRCKEIKAVRKDVYQQRILRYGSEKVLLENYLCRKCRRVVKHQKKIESRNGKKHL